MINHGYGYGYGYGNGNGYGYGNGNGYGYGYGNGDGYGDGNGDGDGNGYGYGNGYGNGYGYGYGNGYGYGYGNGDGYGDGYGYGDGNGYGDGYGNGDGYGIAVMDGHAVKDIDGVPTVLTSIHGDIARGYTLRNNVYSVPCYVARVGLQYAHGETAKEAYEAALAKHEQSKPIEERIADTVKRYPSLSTKVAHAELFRLHNFLTSSCEFGRKEFARAHGLSVTDGEMTIGDFIKLTKDAYGGDVIRRLYEAYKTNNQ